MTLPIPTVTVDVLDTYNDKTAGVSIGWTTSEPVDGVRIEISTAGTRDRAGHPSGGWFTATQSPYANVIPFGTWDVYVNAYGGGEQGEPGSCLGVVVGKKGNHGNGGNSGK